MMNHKIADKNGVTRLRRGTDWQSVLRRRPTRPVTVLLPEGSSSSARQTLYGLPRRYVIDVLDPSLLCQCRFSRRVRRVYRGPVLGKAPGAYLENLVRRLRRGRYDVLFPTHEEVYLLSRYRDTLARHVGVALPPFESVRRLQDKVQFVRLLLAMELPMPASTILPARSSLRFQPDFPCYVKLAHGTAGNGVKYVRNGEELRRAVTAWMESGVLAKDDEVVIQQPAGGIPSVVQAVFQHGRLMACHSAEALSFGIGGGQMVRVGAFHPVVVEHVRRLGEFLAWHGPLFLEYFYDQATCTAQYIEANPRIGETVNARLSGVNFCELVAEIALGSELEPVGSTKPGVRSHNGFLVLVAAALEGANRRQLWALWRRLRRGEGIYRGGQNEMTRPREDRASVIPAGFTIAQLLVNPRSSHRVVNNAVGNYSLPAAAVKAVHALSADALTRLFDDDSKCHHLKGVPL